VSRGLAQLGGGAPSRWLLLLLLTVAAPAFAQIDLSVADKLANGNVANVLAVIVVVQAAVVAYLFTAWRGEVQGRREDQTKHHAETVETLTSVVTLSVKSADGMQVLDRAMDHFTQERR
jgi:hypothetical protein